MPKLTLQGGLKYAKTKYRDEYTKKLQEYLKNFNEDIDTQQLIKDLHIAISHIASAYKKHSFFNRIQMTALLSLESAFFVEILNNKQEDDEQYKQNKEKYKILYKTLYGDGSEFAKALKNFKEKVEIKDHLISTDEILKMDYNDKFQANLELIKRLKDLLDQAKTTHIVLPQADEASTISFLTNIDPQILSYIVVTQNDNPLSIKFQAKNNHDILHESIVAVKAFCCALVQTSCILLPPALILTLGLPITAISWPVTVGIALYLLSLELSYLSDKTIQNDIKKNIEQSGVQMIKDIEQKKIPKTNILQNPVLIFNLPQLMQSLTDYTISSYKNNKLAFSKKIPESIDSFHDLIQSGYISARIDGSVKKLTQAEIADFKKHSKDMLHLTVEKF